MRLRSAEPRLHRLLAAARQIAVRKRTQKGSCYLIKANTSSRTPKILFEFGKICLELDLLDDAISALQKGGRLQPNNDSTRMCWRLLRIQKQYEVAASFSRRC